MVAVFTGQDEPAGCHKRAFSRGLKRSINEGLAIRQLRGATVAGFIFGACNASLWNACRHQWPRKGLSRSCWLCRPSCLNSSKGEEESDERPPAARLLEAFFFIVLANVFLQPRSVKLLRTAAELRVLMYVESKRRSQVLRWCPVCALFMAVFRHLHAFGSICDPQSLAARRSA